MTDVQRMEAVIEDLKPTLDLTEKPGVPLFLEPWRALYQKRQYK